MATGSVDIDSPERTLTLSRLSEVAANVTSLACIDAIVHAEPMADIPSYTSLCPSALR
jgi:hypothetical protein